MTIHQFISVLLIFLHRSLPSVGLFNLHVQTSLNLITTMCSVMWATLKTYFHTFLLVQVSAGSETNHLITLIPIYALELMAAVWEVFGQKKESFISTYIYIFSVVRVWCQLIFVSQCAMTCCTVLVKQRYVQRYFLLTLSTTMTLSLSKVVIVWSLKETTTEPFY